MEKEDVALKIQDGVFSWSSESNERYLNVKNLFVPKGKLKKN